MKTNLCLPTKAAADALGMSTDTLKRKREICGGFLKAGHHWCACSTRNSPLKFCVEMCRQAFHCRERRKREISSRARLRPTPSSLRSVRCSLTQFRMTPGPSLAAQ